MENISATGELLNSPSGAAKYQYFYDEQNRFLRWEVYAKNGLPAIGPTGTAGEYNLFNGPYMTDIVFFDENQKPIKHASGVYQWSMTKDEYGNTAAVNFKDAKGNLMNNRRGIAKRLFQYDASGTKLISEEKFNLHGQLVDSNGKLLSVDQGENND